MAFLFLLPMSYRRKFVRLFRPAILFIFILSPPLIIWHFLFRGWPEIYHQKSFAEFHWPILGELHPGKVAQIPRATQLGAIYNNSSKTETILVQPDPLNPWDNFVPRINPSCAFDHLPRDFYTNFMLIAVKSAPERIEQRKAIRETWGKNGENESWGMWHFRTIFVLGQGNNVEEENRIRQEADQHGDLLIGNFDEADEHSGAIKMIHSIGLAIHYCGSPHPVPFLLLIDDDSILLPWNLAKMLDKYSPNMQLYMGHVNNGLVPNRNRLDKNRIDISQYPFDRYPDHIAGWGILLSGWTVAEFSLIIPYTKLFILEDVWMGIMTKYLGMKTMNNEYFMKWYEFGSWQNVLVANSYTPQQMRYFYPKLEAENAQKIKAEKEEAERKQAEELAKAKKKMESNAQKLAISLLE